METVNVDEKALDKREKKRFARAAEPTISVRAQVHRYMSKVNDKNKLSSLIGGYDIMGRDSDQKGSLSK